MPYTLDPPPATCRDRIAHTVKITRRHPVIAATWVVSFGAQATATATRNPHLGRWGLWIAQVNGVATLYRIARWMITRQTQIYEALHFDVRLGPNPPRDPDGGGGGGIAFLRTGRRVGGH